MIQDSLPALSSLCTVVRGCCECRRCETYNGDGVLADILEPDELESAVSLAVNTLGLVLTDDDVLEGSTLVEQENSVLLT